MFRIVLHTLPTGRAYQLIRDQAELVSKKLLKEDEMNFIVQFAFHLVVVVCADIVVHFGWLLMEAQKIAAA